MPLIDYLAHFSDVSQVQMSTPHQKRFSVTKRHPFPTTIQSGLQQKVNWHFVKHTSNYQCHIKEQYTEQQKNMKSQVQLGRHK